MDWDDKNFQNCDISFVTHLTPLAELSNLDPELVKRCLPILGAGANDPALWDSAVRTASVILEERLRDVGGIHDHSTGRELASKIFSDKGTLASFFSSPSELQGYREIYAGVAGMFRNPSAHRLVDPSPEEGGAFICFVNLLLGKLEKLRTP